MEQASPTAAPARGARPEAGTEDAQNRRLTLGALTLFKLADGLIDPKIVLPWLLSAVGAPGAVIGALVPVREAGALLPQLPLAPRIRATRLRKRVWAAGAAVQGLAALAIGLAALLLDGIAAGLAALAGLGVLAVARAVCSVSQKDLLARTVSKARRGRVTGRAASLGAAAVLGFGLALAGGVVPLTPLAISLAVLVAGGLWIASGALSLALDEPESRPGARERAYAPADLVRPLREDATLRRFVAARALLTPTAFAPPFLVMLAGSEAAASGGLGALGPLVVASGLATILAGAPWGRLADSSSRRAMAAGGAAAALALAASAGVAAGTGGIGGALGAAAAVFAAQAGYEGVRTGRKTYLTNMAGDDQRALYAALSNTAIGGVLVLGGLLGLLSEAIGLPAMLALLAALTAAGAGLALSLPEAATARARSGG